MQKRAADADVPAPKMLELPDSSDALSHCVTLLARLTPREHAVYNDALKRQSKRGAPPPPAFSDKPAAAQLARFLQVVRGQVFLARQATVAARHEDWVAKESARWAPPRHMSSRAAQEKFYARLQADTAGRGARQAAAREERAKREAAALKASKLWAISEKLCRRVD